MTSKGKQIKILEVIGIRAEESVARKKKQPFARNKRASNKTSRTVDTWYPIFEWTESMVWDCIKSNAIPYHYAYDKGMTRLSCVFCVMAPIAQLQIAADNNPELLNEFIEAEKDMDHTFRHGFSLAQLKK